MAFDRWPERTEGRPHEQDDCHVQDQGEEAEAGEKPNSPPPPEKSSTRPVSRAARMLALAHYVERLVEEGTVASYADAGNWA